MSKVIRTQKPSVLPFYAMALVFVVLCAALPAYKLWALLLALGGAAVMFGVAKKVCPPRVVEHEVPFHTGSGDVDEMLAEDPTLNGSELRLLVPEGTTAELELPGAEPLRRTLPPGVHRIAR